MGIRLWCNANQQAIQRQKSSKFYFVWLSTIQATEKRAHYRTKRISLFLFLSCIAGWKMVNAWKWINATHWLMVSYGFHDIWVTFYDNAPHHLFFDIERYREKKSFPQQYGAIDTNRFTCKRSFFGLYFMLLLRCLLLHFYLSLFSTLVHSLINECRHHAAAF